MIKAGVACIPGYHGSNQDPEFLKNEAFSIGFPVLLKAVKGGGGKGMRIVMEPDEFYTQLQSAKSEAQSSFGDDVMLVEKYITTPRHIEVQIFADKHGNCLALGERDCSVQRRHQKILEESPAPNLDEIVRQELWEKARAAALAVGYEGAGTVEFIFDNDSKEFFFMEMNTRLQVEHPVTEMVTGEDLVRWQIIVAEGGRLPFTQSEVARKIADRGHAIEGRIYAENPDMDFIPDSGRLTHLQNPHVSDTVRIDAGFATGDVVSAHYDPMIAKLIVQGSTRDIAIRKLHAALEQYQIAGVSTNIDFLKRVCVNDAFMAGEVETGFISKQKKTLFAERQVEDEVYVQAALAILFFDVATKQERIDALTIPQPSFCTTHQTRCLTLSCVNPDGSCSKTKTVVEVRPTLNGLFEGSVQGHQYTGIVAQWDSSSKIITSFFEHKRLETRVLNDSGNLTIFQQGQVYRLQAVLPSWAEKVMGVKDATHSVLAPMPCKVLKVQIQSGDQVKRGQALVVIESMKMETTIRSPQDGLISRVVHKEGVSCTFAEPAIILTLHRTFAKRVLRLSSSQSLQQSDRRNVRKNLDIVKTLFLDADTECIPNLS